MRALLLGLVGLVAVVGGAEAKKGAPPVSCTLTERTFTVERAALVPQDRLSHAELIGQPARVVRTAGAGHWDAVEIAAGPQRFVVRFDVTPHATPAVMASSWAGSEGHGVDWRRKSSSSIALDADIFDGPLAGLTLGAGSCNQ